MPSQGLAETREALLRLSDLLPAGAFAPSTIERVRSLGDEWQEVASRLGPAPNRGDWVAHLEEIATDDERLVITCVLAAHFASRPHQARRAYAAAVLEEAHRLMSGLAACPVLDLPAVTLGVHELLRASSGHGLCGYWDLQGFSCMQIVRAEGGLCAGHTTVSNMTARVLVESLEPMGLRDVAAVVCQYVGGVCDVLRGWSRKKRKRAITRTRRAAVA